MAIITRKLNKERIRTSKYEMGIKNENYIYEISIDLKIQQKNDKIAILDIP